MPQWRSRNKARLAGLLLLLLLVGFAAGSQAQEQPRELTLWIHPYLPATELVSRFTPLADYLAAGLERPVSIRVQQSYQAHIEFVGRDQCDLAFMGPASYVLMRRDYGDKPLLATFEEGGSPHFFGKIVVRADSPWQKPADLAGHSFAFGDPNSTMSHIVPRALLKKAGVTVDDLARYDFLNSHHDVALAVLGGFFDAGAVKNEVFYMYKERGLRALLTTPPLPEHLFLTRSTLAPELRQQLQTLLLALNSHPRGNEILTAIKEEASGLRAAEAADYDTLAEMMEIIDFD